MVAVRLLGIPVSVSRHTQTFTPDLQKDSINFHGTSWLLLLSFVFVPPEYPVVHLGELENRVQALPAFICSPSVAVVAYFHWKKHANKPSPGTCRIQPGKILCYFR